MSTKKALRFLNRFSDFIVLEISFILTNGSILSLGIEEFGIRHPDYVSEMLTIENNVPCRRVWIPDQAVIKNQVLKLLDSEVCDSSNFELNDVLLQKDYKSEQNRDVLKKYYLIRWAFRSAFHCSKSVAAKQSGKITHYDQPDASNPLRYVKVFHQNIDDDLANRASKLKRRDFINQNEGFLAVAVIVNELCSHHNLSLVVLKNPNFHHELNSTVHQKYIAELERSPTIRPRLFARTLSRLESSAFDVSTRYVCVNSIDFNFIYCSTPAVKVSNIWDLKIIFHAFKRNVWAALWFNLLIYAVILSKTYRLQDMLSSVFALFTSLLSGNVTFGLKHLKRSVLFTVWVLASMLLGNYFTGSMTSLLVKPLEKDVMTKLSHLVQRNYTLVFPAILPTVFQLVSVSVYGGAPRSATYLNETNYSERVNLPFQQTTEMGMLYKILGRNETYHKLGTGIFLEEISYGVRKATLGPWIYCMLIYNRVMAYMKTKELSQNRKNRIVRHCHIGKELIPSGGLFWGFFPPSNQKLMETFQTFQEAGIHAYWITEFYGIGFANKVQERSKIKSPTSIAVEAKENSFSSMKLNEGHVISIFVLWSFGLSFSLAIYIFEGVCKRCVVKFSHENSEVYPFIPWH